MARCDIALFALDASKAYGEKVSQILGIPLCPHEERGFEDGEHKARPLVNVRDRDVYVLHSLYGDESHSVNDKLCRLLFFVGALRDASAGRITVVAPYLCYARKDQKSKFRDPVTTRYVATMFEAVGLDHMITLDVHNLAAYQNAFRCRTDHLEARPLFVKYFAPAMQDQEIIVISPDEGGIKRANRFRHSLGDALGREIPMGMMEKYRSRGAVSGESLFAEVKNRTVIILDDLIGTGTTLARVAKAAREQGAKNVYAAASHGLFVGKANQVFADPVFDKIVVTDAVPPFRLNPALVESKLTVLGSAPLFAEAIWRCHQGGSLTDLLGAEG